MSVSGYSIGEVLQLPARDAENGVCCTHVDIQLVVNFGRSRIGIHRDRARCEHAFGRRGAASKIASELASLKRHKPTLYVLDEPTTGLHLADVRKLIAVLRKLVDQCDTVVVIEHHPEVMLAADRLVELGPKAGNTGDI